MAVTRHFIPASSIASQQIGKRIGEILISDDLVTKTQVGSGLARQNELREQRWFRCAYPPRAAA